MTAMARLALRRLEKGEAAYDIKKMCGRHTPAAGSTAGASPPPAVEMVLMGLGLVVLFFAGEFITR